MATTANTKSDSEQKYRVFRFPEAVRETIGNRPPGETIRIFVGRLVDDRLPGLVAALLQVGVAEHGSTRPVRLPITPTRLGKLCEAAQVTGLPASRLLLMVLAGPVLVDKTPAKSGRMGRQSRKGKGEEGTCHKRTKPKAATSSIPKGRKKSVTGSDAQASPESSTPEGITIPTEEVVMS